MGVYYVVLRSSSSMGLHSSNHMLHSFTNNIRGLYGSDVTNDMLHSFTNNIRGLYGSDSVTNSLRQDGTLRNIRYRMFASSGSKDVDRDAIIESFW